MVFGLCRALLRDPHEAEDAAQQVFLSAHRSLLNGAEPREPAAWLATIARNECWSRISGSLRGPLPSGAGDDAVAAFGDPVAEALRRADLAALWRAIRALPRLQRDALLLRELGGLRYDELAAALAVTEPAVESLLFRARARLRAQLKEAYAAATGVSWLEPLVRLLAGGGAPAAAAKTVAVGLGAAGATATAFLGPALLAPHHVRHAKHRLTAARVSQQPHAQPAARAAPPLLAHVPTVARPPTVLVHARQRHDDLVRQESERARSEAGTHETTAEAGGGSDREADDSAGN